MLLWDGACHVHENFSIEKLVQLKNEHPDAITVAHPECPQSLLNLVDFIGSTQDLLNYTTNSEHKKFLVATEAGILYQMKKYNPDKMFIPVPSNDSTSVCNQCSYMRLNTLEKLYLCLKNESPEILINEALRLKALKPIIKMLEMS
mgnify:FL=1